GPRRTGGSGGIGGREGGYGVQQGRGIVQEARGGNVRPGHLNDRLRRIAAVGETAAARGLDRVATSRLRWLRCTARPVPLAPPMSLFLVTHADLATITGVEAVRLFSTGRQTIADSIGMPGNVCNSCR